MWTEQWERLLRWYARIEKSAHSSHSEMQGEFYRDEFYAFFEVALHMKDWLKNDVLSSSVCADVEDFVKSKPALMHAGSLAIGSKHLSVDDPKYKPAARISQSVTVMVHEIGSPGIATARHEFGVVASGQHQQNAFELATDCLEDWRNYLKSKSLL